jgi:hypothetical protein
MERRRRARRRESLSGVRTRLSACPSSPVQVTTKMSARGSARPAAPLGFEPVFGFSPSGHGNSVKGDRPVAVVKEQHRHGSRDQDHPHRFPMSESRLCGRGAGIGHDRRRSCHLRLTRCLPTVGYASGTNTRCPRRQLPPRRRDPPGAAPTGLTLPSQDPVRFVSWGRDPIRRCRFGLRSTLYRCIAGAASHHSAPDGSGTSEESVTYTRDFEAAWGARRKQSQ